MAVSINTQVTIDATNKWLDVWDAVGGNQSFAITEQTYADMPAVCTALQTGLQALGGTWAAATVTVIFTGSVPGMVKIDSAQAVNATSIRWSTGAHGSGALDTHIGTVLGFDDTADDTGAFNYTSDWQHQKGWYDLRAPVRYGPLNAEQIGGELQIPLSSKSAKIVHIGFRNHYELVLAELIPAITYAADATGVNVNRDLETEWKTMCQGDWFRLREDQTVLGTSTDFYLVEPRIWQGNLTRPHIDYESYNITMRFVRKES